jgi:Protein of unknown function (DUF2971)
MADTDMLPPDLRAEIDKFYAIAKRIVENIAREVNATKPSSTIYHYTNDAGLRGIIESGRLWLTDIFNLNDPSELSHGFSHATAIVNDKASKGDPFTKLFDQSFQEFATGGGLQAAGHFFVCSFSSNGDELGQWRAYADDGRGYALGFDALMLEDAFVKASKVDCYNNSTFHVRYDDAQLFGIHRQLVDLIFPLITLPLGVELPKGAAAAWMNKLTIALALNVAQSVIFFKHEAYKNEEEYRFLQLHRADIDPPEVKFRSRPYVLVRYREFEWRSAASTALRKIVIGPSADERLARQFANDCLRAFHKGPVEIVNSTIPYRAA